MTAGAEMDEEVAEQVFGQRRPLDLCGQPCRGPWAPRYSTSLAAAEVVLTWLVEHTPQQDLHIETIAGDGWRISCCNEDDAWVGWVEGATLPEAICRAALELARKVSS